MCLSHAPIIETGPCGHPGFNCGPDLEPTTRGIDHVNHLFFRDSHQRIYVLVCGHRRLDDSITPARAPDNFFESRSSVRDLAVTEKSETQEMSGNEKAFFISLGN
jgi:hypothetical protein